MRGFSEQERQAIYRDLLSVGREQFVEYGPERTRIKDITDPVGIAKATFYQFFDSKGELYLEVLRHETEALAAEVRSDVATIETGREALEHLFVTYRQFVERNPDLMRVLAEHHPRELFRNVPAEKIQDAKAQWFETHLPIVEAIQEKSEEPLASREPREILELLRPVAVMQLYKERGTTRSDEEFDRLQTVHIETLVRGLTARDGPSR